MFPPTGIHATESPCSYTESPAPNDKIKHHVPSTIKCIGEIDTFLNTGPHKVPYMLSRSHYGRHT